MILKPFFQRGAMWLGKEAEKNLVYLKTGYSDSPT